MWLELWLGLALPGVLTAYSRHNDTDPLEHDLRAEILGIVDALPGIYLARLIDRANRPSSTVRYHTRILEREDHLQRATVWGNLRLYPAHVDQNSFAYYAAIRDPPSALALRAIEAYGPVTPGRLADLLGRAPSTVSHHLARFEEAGLIERRRDGESVHVELVDLSTPNIP